MFKWIFALIFIFSNFAITFTVTLYNSIPEWLASETLAKISLNEALPLVIFEVMQSVDQCRLQDPKDIFKVETLNGKMVSGTQFYTEGPGNQKFFCRKLNQGCLAPQSFGYSEYLKCSNEPIPFLKEIQQTQHIFNNVKCYNVIYEICPSEESYQYMNTVMKFYKFCYSLLIQKTIYTSHFIRSPKLLQSSLLLRERELIYNFWDPYDFPQPANIWEIRNSLIHESNQARNSTASNPLVNEASTSSASILPMNPMYQVQKLAPSEDMALAVWMKPFYLTLNAELQHIAIFPLWNEMGKIVRTAAIEMSRHGIKLFVRTGVFDIPIGRPVYDEQKYNIWVKMILSMENDGKFSKGVVFLMNNFLNSLNFDSEGEFLDDKIETYCKSNLCHDDFKYKVMNAGGKVRCCPLTKEIAALFGKEHLELPLLQFNDLV